MNARKIQALPMTWHSMKTAPKDVRIILLYEYPRLVVVGFWRTDKYAVIPRPYWGNDREPSWGREWLRTNNPSHWIPLPMVPR